MKNTCTTSKTVESYLRGLAGVFLLLSVILTHYHSANWIWFTVFIGVNLLQSAFTNWCPMVFILEKGFKLDNRASD